MRIPILVLAIGCLAICGCGRSDQNTQATSSTTSGVATLTAEPRLGEGVLVVPLPAPAPVVVRLSSEPHLEAIQAGDDVALVRVDGTFDAGYRPAPGTRLSVVDGDIEVRVNRADAASVELPVITSLIDSATWTTVDGGQRLVVVPGDLARSRDPRLIEAAWREVITRQPGADTPGMADQYRCHAQAVPDRAEFHLEPWRPAVGYAQTLLARCNPGGPEPA
ncbi:MAG: DUF2599 domain-containing protein [Actinomycetales bacterium]